MSDRTTSVRRPCVCEIAGRSFTMKVVEITPGYYLAYQCARCGRIIRIQKVRP